MKKRSLKLLFLTIALISLPLESGICNPEKNSARHSIERFLKGWLVNKNWQQVEAAFHKTAFSSRIILSEDCGGFISEEDRKSSVKVRRRVLAFLKDLSRKAQGKSLKQILVIKEYASEDTSEDTIEGIILARPEQNGYLLVESKKLIFSSEENWAYLNSVYPAESYCLLAALIRIKTEEEKVDFPIHFVWALTGKEWKIIHVDMQCV